MLPYYDIYDNKFNLIINHRSDSDIVGGYGRLKPLDTGEAERQSKKLKKTNFAEGKTGLVSWIVSICKAPSHREMYADELSKYLPLHIYGFCGSRNLGSTHEDALRVKKSYKFYLAFENSLCKDYATEKLWDTMSVGTVPIVLGGANYSDILPENSYIDIKDFSSPKELADYVLKVDKDDELYNSYFKWKAKFDIDFRYHVHCQLCKYLNEYYYPPKVYSDFHGWLDKCIEPGEYYSGVADAILDNVLNNK